MSTTKTGCEFFDNEASELNKTGEQVLKEKVLNFLKTSIIECKSQISTRNVLEIPKKKLDLENAQLELERANEEVEKLKVKVPTDGKFNTYLSNLYAEEVKSDKALEKVEKLKSEISTFEKEVKKLEITLNRFETNLAKLKK